MIEPPAVLREENKSQFIGTVPQPRPQGGFWLRGIDHETAVSDALV